MSTTEILKEAYTLIDNKISQSTFIDISETIIDSLIKKFGKSTVSRYAGSDDTSEINNVLTHVIEVGSLKAMKDAGLIINTNTLTDRCIATAFIMNHSLAQVLKQKGAFNYSRDGYFTFDGVQILAARIHELCGTHLSYNNLPQHVKNDTFTVDELFAFYLGDYYVKKNIPPFTIVCKPFVENINYGSIASEKNLADAMKSWENCLFDISNSQIRVSHNGEIIFESPLELIEADEIYETFLGNINSFQKFRFLKSGNTASLIMNAVHKKHQFTIASVLPHGFAITYTY
ncbi:hypothetical protein [Hymenobacter psychrotolerans]|uniref:Uncharacterized protein n=1 Tax=Hymenobacter psychrotolerans DSM 18569 TaxID=1121959 RepID=A0A1M7HJU9_9BACT|nr:hypothetical protein [Hymenobacter psychrotolerans]SHM28718.1 hypothetical protein SAMN02746009_04242 [Hymenobacter psychrotolerans DSM 18569]